MANKKLTKREMYNELKEMPEVQAKEHLIKFIDRELELLARKNSSDKKPTATQKANEKLKEVIVETLKTANKPLTISEMQKLNKELSNDKASNQKISALMKQLVETDGKVEKFIEKRKAYFQAL